MPTKPTDSLLKQSDLIAVAAIVIGFALTVIMFRIQREIYVKEEKGEDNWITWSDWLIFVSVFLVLFFVVTPLLAFGYRPLASPALVAAIILQAGYIPAILAHYRITFGKNRKDEQGRELPREKGEPAERCIVLLSALVAVLFFVLTWQQPSQ